MDNILGSVKDFLSTTDASYDDVIKVHINSVFFGLYQLGVMPVQTISTGEELWSGLLVHNPNLLPVITQITFLRVKLLFDVTQSQAALLKEHVEELESRCVIETDTTII